MRFLSFLRATGFAPTTAQRVFVKVAIDRTPLHGDEEVGIAAELFGPVDLATVPPIAFELLVLVKGARIGGTRLSSTYLVWRALTAKLATLAPREIASGLIVAPDLRLARQGLRFARGAVAALPDVERAIVSEGTDGFVLRRPDGAHVAVEALPATRGGSALRGRSLIGVVLSECAFFRDADSGVVNDQDVYRAVAPRVMPGGAIVLESTPWLEAGLLYELHRDNFGEPKTALAATAPTLLMRPELAGLVERERRRDPDNARTEYGAQFMGGGAAAFFDDATIRAAVDEDRPPVVKAPPSALVGAGADFGLVSDSSALAIVANEAAVLSLSEIVEHRPKKGAPLKLSEVVASFAETMAVHGVRTVLADGHVREPAREFADAAKITIDAAPEGQAGKWETYDALRQAMREGRVRLPDHPRLIAQLRAIVAQAQPGGGFSIRSPRRAGGGHGDLVSALVLAAWAAKDGWSGPRTRGVFVGGSEVEDMGAGS